MKPVSATFTFAQDKDSCDSGDPIQNLEVTVDDAGGGRYAWIKTDRWAIDDAAELAQIVGWCIWQCRDFFADEPTSSPPESA